MKRLIIIFLCITMCGIGAVSAKVYYSESSNSIYNVDGISQSGTVFSSPIGGEISLKPVSVTGSFAGAVFDGDSMWLVPYSAENIVCIKADETVEAIEFPEGYTPTEQAFYGGAFDGEYIYFAPYAADGIIRIKKSDHAAEYITAWPEGFDKSAVKFKGAVFDGQEVWLIPSEGTRAVAISGDTLTAYSTGHESIENGYCGGVYSGDSIYFVPDKSDTVIKMDAYSGEVSTIKGVSGGYCGGFFDGDVIYFIPGTSDKILKINKSDSSVSTVSLPGDVSGSFAGGAFDGRYFWMAPTEGEKTLRYDIFTDEFSVYETAGQYLGGTFDGKNVWFAPLSAEGALKISGDNTPPVALNVFLTTTVGVAVSGEMSATDADSEDTIVFEKLSDPEGGVLEVDSQTGAFTYTPEGEYSGVDTFTYCAFDGADYSNTATVSIMVNTAEMVTDGGRYIDLWGHWAEPYAEALTDMEVFLGENVDEYYYFYPDYTLTRAGFTVLANSTFGLEGSTTDSTLPYTDLEGEPAWVILAASAATHGNMISGFPTDEGLEFRPYEQLTRIEAATMIYNIITPAAAPGEDIDFADRESIPEWSEDIVRSMKSIGLLSGYDDNTLRPYQSVTRAEAIKMLYEAVSYMGNSDMGKARLK